jgi:hypothetical protein
MGNIFKEQQRNHDALLVLNVTQKDALFVIFFDNFNEKFSKYFK